MEGTNSTIPESHRVILREIVVSLSSKSPGATTSELGSESKAAASADETLPSSLQEAFAAYERVLLAHGIDSAVDSIFFTHLLNISRCVGNSWAERLETYLAAGGGDDKPTKQLSFQEERLAHT